jgi:prephenate dehydrogenase
MDAEAHDTAVALTSHSAHLVSSAMAGALAETDPAVLRLAGTGIRDVTRIAEGDPALWTDILGLNATRVAAFLSGIAADLFEACAALELVGTGDATFLTWVTDLLARGRAGRRLDPERTAERDL